MRFFIMQIEYKTGPEDADDAMPSHKTQVIYQFRGEVPDGNVGLENILYDDMRQEIGDMKGNDDIVTLVEEVKDPGVLRVLKLWNQRCIDFESCLFAEGTVYENERSNRTHSEGASHIAE